MKRVLIFLTSSIFFACGPAADHEIDSTAQAVMACTTIQRGVDGSIVSDATIYDRLTWVRDGLGTNLWTGSTYSGIARSLLRWDLSAIPPDARILSAKATVYASNANLTTVRVHRVTAAWPETTTSWASFGDAFDPEVLATFDTGGWGHRSFDLTAQVQTWVWGELPNHGVLLQEDPTTYRTGYGASENTSPSRRPSLIVCWDEEPEAPPPPPDSPSMTIAVFGDYGALGPGLDKVSAMVDAWNPDAIITTGDNVYLSDPEPYDLIVGRYYHRFIGGYRGAYGAGADTNRFWPTIGNHDFDHLSAYVAFFDLPGNERYYEAPLGAGELARLFAYDSDRREPDGGAVGSVQATWLRDRLAASTACFDIVALHEAPHASMLGHEPRVDLRLPYRSWGADILFAGHMHGYERLLVNRFPHVIVGTGGGSLWGSWTGISPYSVYRYPVSPTGWGAALVTVRVGGGTGEMTIEFYAPGIPEPIDRYSFTKYCP